MQPLSTDDITRYARQLSLLDFTPAHQQRLKNAQIFIAGAGGLGAVVLPYLAGAGIGQIVIADYDEVDISNLHRQTIYKTEEAGHNKAVLAATYGRSLNPTIEIQALKSIPEDPDLYKEYDVILDCTDNFKTKDLLNTLSVQSGVPLISASVLQYQGQCGIFAGTYKDMPCYRCLFPDLPENACNCNDAGVLGTSAGLAGLYQAHITIQYLLAYDQVKPGLLLSLDFLNLKVQKLRFVKNKTCTHCTHNGVRMKTTNIETGSIPLYSLNDLPEGSVIIDVRQPEEVAEDPIAEAQNIPLGEIPLFIDELPENRTIALVCAANIRSRQGAEYLIALGFDKVCILDKFSL